MQQAYDVAIVGGGPAGLSAALILGRARRSVLVIDDGHQRNRPVRESHGFLGHDGLSPHEFLGEARSQLDAYLTIECLKNHVDEISGEIERFTICLQSGERISARRIVFATGVHDDLPDIDGILTLWGKRVFVCPYCDGWEFRDRPMAVLGNSRSALELAQELWNWSHDLTVCATSKVSTPHELYRWQAAAGVRDTEAPPTKMYERNGSVVIECSDGSALESAVVFVCAPLRQHSDLPAALGCELTERGTIRVDGENRTTVAGCYAAGDCITHHHQIVFAAASGARAAIAINEEFYESDARRLVE